MDERTNRFLTSIVTQLQQLHQQTISLFEAVPLGGTLPASLQGGHVQEAATVLRPTVAQRATATLIHSEYRAWVDMVLVFLQRSVPEQATIFSDTAALLATYILFQRSGKGISDTLWREFFRRESATIVSYLIDLILSAKDAFNIFKTRTRLQYDEFVLKIRRNTAPGEYVVEARAERGEAESVIQFPFDEHALENFMLKHCRPENPNVRSWTPRVLRPFSEFGHTLYDAILVGPVRDLFYRVRQHADSCGRGVRVVLRLNAVPELGSAPWEFLFDGRDFLSLSLSTPLIRYVDSGIPPRPLATSLPLRILVTHSSPSGISLVDAENEWRNLVLSLAPMTKLGLLRIDHTPDGRLRTIQRLMRQAELSGQPYHIWHYIGHGNYDEEESASVLALEGERRSIAYTSGFELGTMFGTYPSLKLAVLNACEGARSGHEDTFSGVASALAERGMAAVVAMQFKITNEAASAFSEEFYSALVDGVGVDTAVTEARRAIFFQPNPLEWATPVLFLRNRDGVIFDMGNVPIFDHSIQENP